MFNVFFTYILYNLLKFIYKHNLYLFDNNTFVKPLVLFTFINKPT